MDRIKELREEYKITQKQLSEILGVTRTAVSKWEAGENGPNSEILVKLADYFNVSTDYLLGLTETKNAPVKLDKDERSEVDKLVWDVISKLTDEQKQLVLALANQLPKKDKE